MDKRTNGALQQMINVHKKKRIRKIEKEISLEDLRIIENLKTFPQKAEVQLKNSQDDRISPKALRTDGRSKL